MNSFAQAYKINQLKKIQEYKTLKAIVKYDLSSEDDMIVFLEGPYKAVIRAPLGPVDRLKRCIFGGNWRR